MTKIYSALGLTVILLCICFNSFSQKNFFSLINESEISLVQAKRVTFPEKFRTIALDNSGMKNYLWALPNESDAGFSKQTVPVFAIPRPDGILASFHLWETNLMEPALAAKFSEMRTFSGRGIDDPTATIQVDYNPYSGFHAQVLSDVTGNYYLDPYARGNIDGYMAYYAKDNKRPMDFSCLTENNFAPTPSNSNIVPVGNCRGTQLYTYRLALACTGEYAVAVCSPAAPTIPLTAAAMLTTVNRVDGVYEKELSLRMVLVGNNNNIIYLDGSTDPYTNNNGSSMLGQNQTNIDFIIGSANYDIGHVVSTGGGGIAGLRVPCGNSKARGVTGLNNPVGDNFDIDYVAHEMGHQWGGNHTFNSSLSSCGSGNRNANTAYEVGSGSSIQAYAGICSTDDIQPHSDPHFHSVSFDEISVFLEGGGAACRVVTPTGNTLPQITSMDNNGVSIPIGTPFTLNGTATDADGDALTYSWEEWDLGPSTTWNGGNGNTTSPLFKSRIPKATGSRTFPDMAVILANYPANPAIAMGGLRGETLPTTAREMKFRLTVRDNRADGGGVVTGGDGCQAGFTGTFKISTSGTAPFAVTAPNGGETFGGLTSQTITWNVSGTDVAPVSTANVSILLSLDGGLTYPTVLLASTPNDGTEIISIPNTATTTARIKVQAINNIFFDISNANFTITVATPGFVFNPAAPANVVCGGPSTATIDLGTSAVLGFTSPVTLSATNGVPAGASISFGTNPVTPGNSSLVTFNNASSLNSGTYGITVTGVAGSVTRSTLLSFIIGSGSAPAISSQPADANQCIGANATFNVAASGAGAVSYQWQLSTDAGTSFTNIAGATASGFTLNGVVAGQANNLYRAVIIGQCGSTTSRASILTISTPIAITSQPIAATACLPAQSTATFTTAATGTGASYQWQVSTDGGTTFSNLAGATGASLTLNNLSVSMSGNQYRAVISGACNPAVNSNTATLTVNTLANITNQPTNRTICTGANTGFSVAASGNNIAYQWQASVNNGAFADISNSAVYSGVNSANLNITAAPVAMSGTRYQVVITSAPCGSVTSGIATLNVNALPSADLAAAPVTTLTPYQNTVLSVNGNSQGAFTYQWLKDGSVLSNTAGGSLPVNVDGIGDYSVVITDGNGCVATSNVVSITAGVSDMVFIYPNPNSGNFQVRYYNASAAGTYKVNIYDSKGSSVHSQAFTQSSAYTQMNINLRRVQAGIYRVEVRDNQNKRLASSNVLIRN